MTWGRGRERIEQLLASGKLERVGPAEIVAHRLLDDANAHIRLATTGLRHDPAGALQLSYDAARKAAAALLAVQGLRATTIGGHVAVIDAVKAQFDEPPRVTVFGKLHRLRRARHATEYPSVDSPSVTRSDAERALVVAREVVTVASDLLESGELSPFE